MKIKPVITVILIMIMCMCGCTPSDSSDLLSPPKETGERAGIRSAIEASVGESVVFKYPLSGEYRSAIIMKDMDGDGEEETIAFYKRASADKSIHIIALDDDNGKWSVCNDIIGPGSEIDKIMFTNMDGEGSTEVVISWSVFSNVQKVVRIYSFDVDGIFTEVSTSDVDPETLESRDITYNEILFGDFDGDGKDELMTFVLASATNQTAASANMIEYYYNSDTRKPFTTVTWTTAIDSSVISFQKIKGCYISEIAPVRVSNTNDADSPGLYAVVVDGVNAQNMMVTDVVGWDSSAGIFKAPFCDAETGLSQAFVRSDWVLSQDINSDGFVELPSAELMPSYSEGGTEKLYMLKWNRYVSDSETHVSPVLNTIHNQKDGYYVIVPDDWVGKVTAKLDSAGSTLYFYAYDEENGAFGKELFRVHVCTEEDFSKLKKQKFFKLATVGTRVYCARVQDVEVSNGSIVSEEVLASLFKLIE